MRKPPNRGAIKPYPQVNDEKGKNNHQRIHGDVEVSGTIRTQLPPDFLEDYKTSSGKENRRENKRFILEIITLASVLAVARFAYIQTNQAVQSANAAIDSAKTARDQLELSGRPWVSISPSIESQLWFDENGANIMLKFKLRNSGLSPAARVFAMAELVPIATDKAVIQDQKKQACADARTASPDSEVTIFPAVELTEERKVVLSSERVSHLTATNNGILLIGAVVCTAYTSSVGHDKNYSTDGQMFRIEKNSHNYFRGFFPGQDVPEDQLMLELSGENATLIHSGRYEVMRDDFTIARFGSEATSLVLPKDLRPDKAHQTEQKR